MASNILSMREWTRPICDTWESFEGISKKEATDLYYSLMLIRSVELKIEEEYYLDEMKTPVHLCIGQEAISAGVCCTLRNEDFVFSNHRSHGHYLAKKGNIQTLIAELYNRETGCSKGKGGSMHVVDTSVGLMGSSSIVAGGIPLAVGAAFTSKYKKKDSLSVAFFGDGAVDEGTMYESVNLSMLWELPVIFVCENNFYAVCSPCINRQYLPNLYQRFNGLGIPSFLVDGSDVLAVYKLFREIVSGMRKKPSPVFVECCAYRWRGHAGAGSDAALGYRDMDEIELWMKRCPVENYERRLIEENILAKTEVEIIKNEINKIVDNAFSFAKNSPLPEGSTVMDELFCSEGGIS